MTSDRHHDITERAYAIWEAEGRPDGRHDEHWHRAVAEIETEKDTQSAAHAAPSSGPAEAAGQPALRSQPVSEIAAPPDEAGETHGHAAAGGVQDSRATSPQPRAESAKVAGTSRSGAKRDGQRVAANPKPQGEPGKVSGTGRRGGKNPA